MSLAIQHPRSGFFGDFTVICGVLVQGAVEIRSPCEKLSLWERREQELTPLWQLKGRKYLIVLPMKIPHMP